MSTLHLALALGGPRPSSPAFWSHLAREAETGLLDLLTLDPAGSGEDRAEELGAVLAATRLAATTRSVGLVPAVHVGRSEPARIARAVGVLGRVSRGRAGVQLHVPIPDDEQGWVAAVRRRWTADGAATGAGSTAEPVVALPGRPGRGRRAVPAAADLGFLAPRSTAEAQRLVSAARSAEQAPSRLLGDVVVVLDEHADRARIRAARSSPSNTGTTAPPDALVLAGSPAELADLAQEWHAAGLAGLRLHPADPVTDLRGITRGLVPELQRRGAFRRSYAGSDLRERLLGSTAPAAPAAPERAGTEVVDRWTHRVRVAA